MPGNGLFTYAPQSSVGWVPGTAHLHDVYMAVASTAHSAWYRNSTQRHATTTQKLETAKRPSQLQSFYALVQSPTLPVLVIFIAILQIVDVQ